MFDAPDGYKPKLTLYRDVAGWCPYCEKTILLVEEKRVPINIKTVPMVSNYIICVCDSRLMQLIVNAHILNVSMIFPTFNVS